MSRHRREPADEWAIKLVTQAANEWRAGEAATEGAAAGEAQVRLEECTDHAIRVHA